MKFCAKSILSTNIFGKDESLIMGYFLGGIKGLGHYVYLSQIQMVTGERGRVHDF